MLIVLFCFFFKQKTAYEMRISDWSSDVCSSDLPRGRSAACYRPRRRKAPVAPDTRQRIGGAGYFERLGGGVARHRARQSAVARARAAARRIPRRISDPYFPKLCRVEGDARGNQPSAKSHTRKRYSTGRVY